MKKYIVFITCKEIRAVTVEAENEEQAIETAYTMASDSEFISEDYEYEAEEQSNG